ncbi:NAD(P)H-hydrate dehydratase [Aurantiacibacter xanthus]|uniref:Bifunctional NAD(P)H-hydrate repair enzyme n=1 Tax=Aurantiacibacter xanthus TaxID=1784712 RepID=A0A3A1P682_9SPHN|nr:NAD(P)H-hydrate dehydratase [Aurantiacibacter xanthus]RIV89561.1 NAD(P)H-hydrate dehydratase [Aurantiacibacter xanthus]
MDAPNQILTAAQMRAGEERLIADGTSVTELMERAGRGAADWVFRVAAGRKVTVLCGPGNNGGDGYVIARVLAERGVPVEVVAPRAPTTDVAKEARKRWGGEPVVTARGAVLVDCLFGTGLSRPLSGDLHRLLIELSYAHNHWIAVDLPSGIDADSGELLNDVLPVYSLTLALGAWKLAHWMMPAQAIMGDLRLVDIGVEPEEGAAGLSERPTLFVPERDAHKYARGLLAVIGGAMPGAGVLASRAAMHGGAGYVKLYSDHDGLPGVPPDLVVAGDPMPALATDPRIAAVLIGPGLGRSEEARSVLSWVLACDLPTVCDADALVLLEPEMLEDRSAPLVLTPHAGELDAIGNAFASSEPDRLEQVTELAEAIEGVLVAKGPDTIVAAPGRPPVFMPPAPSWLSTAGTGDVLAGLIASQLAVGETSAFQAAQNGCWLHREAALRAGPAFSASGLVAQLPAAYGAFL